MCNAMQAFSLARFAFSIQTGEVEAIIVFNEAGNRALDVLSIFVSRRQAPESSPAPRATQQLPCGH